MVNGSGESLRVESGEARKSVDALRNRQAEITRYDGVRRFIERANRSGVQRIAAAVTESELPCATDLLRQGASRAVGSGGKGPKADAAAPQRQRQQCQRQQYDRRAVLPHERKDRWMILFGKEGDVIARPQIGRGNEQPRMVAAEQVHFPKRLRVDDGDTAASDLDARRLEAG